MRRVTRGGRGLPKLAGALRGHRRAGTVWHGAKARLGSMVDPFVRSRCRYRATDAFWPQARMAQRRCQIEMSGKA